MAGDKYKDDEEMSLESCVKKPPFSFHKKCALLALLLSCSLLSSACAGRNAPRYEVLGTVSLETSPPLDFAQLFNRMYDGNTQEVFAQVLAVSMEKMTIRVDEVLMGSSLFPQQEYQVVLSLQGELPEVNRKYLFFLHLDGQGRLLLKDDPEYGILEVENQIVTSHKNGNYLSIEKVRNESATRGKAITLPNELAFYRDLESLVAGSDHIFIGELLASQNRKQSYYIENSGISTQRSSESTFWLISVSQPLKGGYQEGQEVRVVSTPIMLELYDGPSQNLPQYYVGGRYLFFVVNPPSMDSQAEKLFINPIQGYVPIVGNSDLMPVYSNPVFSAPSTLSDALFDITAILNIEPGGESGS